MKLGGETRVETEQETERGELKETFYAGMKPSFKKYSSERVSLCSPCCSSNHSVAVFELRKPPASVSLSSAGIKFL